MDIQLPEGMTPEMCQYLENLRQSGVTNMFGAGPFLQDAFDLSRREGSDYLMFWMQNYSELQEAGIIERNMGAL